MFYRNYETTLVSEATHHYQDYDPDTPPLALGWEEEILIVSLALHKFKGPKILFNYSIGQP